MDEAPSLRRRRLLVAAGAGAATVSLTGCLDSTQGAGDDAEDEGEGDGHDADFVNEPVDYPDESCAVCARGVTDYPGWNAQMVHEDGERAFFCTSGCMGAYYTSPSSFGVSDAEIAGVWVTDYETGETVDGTDAYYIFVRNPELVDIPAGRNPLPFAERGRAEEFTQGFDEIDASDIDGYGRINFNRCVW